MDIVPVNIFYIGIPLILICIYIIWNLLRKVEKLEDEIAKSDNLSESVLKDFNDAYSKMVKIDRQGAFEADDESGFIFSKIKSILNDLNKTYNNL